MLIINDNEEQVNEIRCRLIHSLTLKNETNSFLKHFFLN